MSPKKESITQDDIIATILAIAHSDIAERFIREKKREDTFEIIFYSVSLLLLAVLFFLFVMEWLL